MGVITTSDELLESAKENINLAADNIAKALDSNTWGSDQYNNEYMVKVASIWAELIIIKAKWRNA